MDYLKFLRIINNGYDPMLLLGKGGLNYRPRRNIEGRALIIRNGKYIYEPDEGMKKYPTIYDESEEETEEKSDEEESEEESEKGSDEESEDEETKKTKKLIKKHNKLIKKDEEMFEKYLEEQKDLVERLKEENEDENFKFNEKEQDLYYALATEKIPDIEVDESEWDELKDNDIEIKHQYEDLQLENLNEYVEEIENGTYEKPFGNVYSSKQFERSFTDKDNTICFLRQVDKEFNDLYLGGDIDIQSIKIIDTGEGSEDLGGGVISRKKIEYIDYTEKDKNGNYVKKEFRTDKYYPVDTIVLFKLKDGEGKKFTIEQKYYDNTEHFTGLKDDGLDLKGKPTTYKEICENSIKEFNSYKKSILTSIAEIEKEIMINKKYDIDASEYIAQLDKLKSIVDDERLLKHEFNKFCKSNIPIGLSKAGETFEHERKSQYNDPIAYTLLRKKHAHGQKVLRYNDNGYVNGIEGTLAPWKKASDQRLKRNDLKGYQTHKDLSDYSILLGSKSTFAFSYKDALVGYNWSEKLKSNKNLIGNPLHSHRVARTAYGREEDIKGAKGIESKSLALHPDDSILIRKIKDRSTLSIENSLKNIELSSKIIKHKVKKIRTPK